MAPNSPNLNPLNYQVWEQYWSLITSCKRRQYSSRWYDKDALQLIWSALLEEAVDNAVKTSAKDCSTCVGQR